ncbi:VOC family protein [Streptomyces sp. NPDC006691]|uniref:VOC family protein n=1 Tax=Streptomyces sp. NPDC006691 TaxID=3364757 RepID=UPI0036D04A66
MTLHWKLVVDASDPHAQADFWAAALGYEVEDNSLLINRLSAAGAIGPDLTLEHGGRIAFRDLVAVRHPDDSYDPDSGTGLGRRILFQRVPEKKTVKNRMHIDVHSAPGERAAEVDRIAGLGATVQRQVREAGAEFTLMTDPEGNEFCVH